MLERLGGTDSGGRVRVEQLADLGIEKLIISMFEENDHEGTYQVFRLLGDVVPFGRAELVLAGHDIAQHHHLLAMPEGRKSHQQRVHDHTARPQVHLLAIPFGVLVPRRPQQLGRQVAGRAAQIGETLLRLDDAREPKISHLDVVVVIEQNVLRLQVAVHHIVRVNVLHRLEQLLHDHSGGEQD